MPWRNITAETMAHYDVKTKIDKDGKPVCLIAKWPNGHCQYRSFEDKEFYLDKGKPLVGLFGADKFSSGGHPTITITEGWLDALSLHQVTRSPVVSVASGSSAKHDIVAARSFVGGYEKILFGFDNDPVGATALSQCAGLVDPAKLRILKYGHRKDANEYLMNGEQDQLRMLFLNAKAYLPDNIKSSLSDFQEILSKGARWGTPYPFNKLTEMTYGIRTGEAVLVIAQEKVGKTELLHFIEHKLLTETKENVGAIFLEEPNDRHLQALAGIELGRPCHLPDAGVSGDEMFGAVRDVLGVDNRLYLFNNFGSMDPDVLCDQIRYLVSAHRCKFVLLDHITMVLSGLGEVDERRSIDRFTTKLETLVKELDFALIAVSHVNDNGQTRGSRFPTKVFDITISASRDLQAVDLVERSTISLRVLFNRFCGRTGPAGRIVFNPETYSFTEELETIVSPSIGPEGEREHAQDEVRGSNTGVEVSSC